MKVLGRDRHIVAILDQQRSNSQPDDASASDGDFFRTGAHFQIKLESICDEYLLDRLNPDSYWRALHIFASTPRDTVVGFRLRTFFRRKPVLCSNYWEFFP